MREELPQKPLMRIIGLSGKSRSGKDTVADIIVRLRKGKLTYKVSFAEPIKEQAREMGWNGKKDTNGRVLLQYIGLREREDDPEHWVDKLFEKIGEKSEGWDDTLDICFVITDVRFKNEAQAIEAEGGVVWRVEREGAGLEGEAGEHPSETQLDDYERFDRTLQNNASLEELKQLVKRSLENST